MVDIAELVEAARKVLDESGERIIASRLYITVSNNEILGQDFKEFQDTLNKTGGVEHKVKWGFYNNVHTVYWTPAKTFDQVDLEKKEKIVEELLELHKDGLSYSKLPKRLLDNYKIAASESTLKHIFVRAKNYDSRLSDTVKELFEILYVKNKPLSTLRKSRLYTKGREIENKAKGSLNELEGIVEEISKGPKAFDIDNTKSLKETAEKLKPLGALLNITGFGVKAKDLFEWLNPKSIAFETFRDYLGKAKKLAKYNG